MKAKELLQKELPVGRRFLRSMGSKILDMAKKGFNEARKALADGMSGDSTSMRGRRPKPSLVSKKSSVSSDGKKLIAAIDKLYKTEKQIKRETEQNTRINSRKVRTPVVQPLQPVVEPVTTLMSNISTPEAPVSLSLHHPDQLRHVAPRAPAEPKVPQIPGSIPKRSLLFGAKDLQSVKLKGVLKGASSSTKRRVSFGENNFKTISPRPSPRKTESTQPPLDKPLPFTAGDLKQAALCALSETRQQSIAEAPASAPAISFNAIDLQKVQLKPPVGSGSSKSSSSSGSKGVTSSALKSIRLKPLQPTVQPLPRANALKRPLSLEDQLKQAFDQKFRRTRSPDRREEEETREEEDAEEWLS